MKTHPCTGKALTGRKCSSGIRGTTCKCSSFSACLHFQKPVRRYCPSSCRCMSFRIIALTQPSSSARRLRTPTCFLSRLNLPTNGMLYTPSRTCNTPVFMTLLPKLQNSSVTASQPSAEMAALTGKMALAPMLSMPHWSAKTRAGALLQKNWPRSARSSIHASPSIRMPSTKCGTTWS